MTPSYK